MKRRYRAPAVVFFSALLTLASGPVSAQIDEIRVSARKLDEDLQRVPIAITAIGDEEVTRKGLVNLDTLLQQTPSLILDRAFGPSDQRIVVRGLAPTRGRQNVAILQDGIDISSEAITTGGGSLLINPRLFDLERVEIVTGPQNALYGRSAFNGAINYVTRKPGDDFYARVGGQVGNFDNQEVNFQVSGPLTDGLSAGLTGMYWNLDGFFDNGFTGGTMGGEEGASLAGTVVIEPTDTLSLTARVEYLDDEFGITPFLNMPFNAEFDIPQSAIDQQGPGFASTTIPGVTGEALSVASKLPTMSEESRTCTDPSNAATCGDFSGTEREITRATLTVDWDLGGLQFTSLTHVADAETFVSQAGDDTSAAVSIVVQEINDLRQTDLLSQELRLASSTSGPLTWVVGGLFWREQVEVTDGSYTCINYFFLAGQPDATCGPPMAQIGVSPDAPYNPSTWERETEHYSLYGLVEWEFVENWKIAFEGRRVWEDLSYGGPDFDRSVFDPSGQICALVPVLGCIPIPQTGPGTDIVFGTTVPGVGFATEDDNFFAPKLTLTWNATDDVMSYLSFAQAFKPKGISQITGGFGTWFDRDCEAEPGCDPVEQFRFDRERLNAYELGFKTNWAENRLQLNGAVFFQDFKNKQVSQQIVGEDGLLVPIVSNAGEAEVLGLELSALWLPTDNLSLSLGYTFLDTEFTEYLQFTGGVGTPAYVGNCTPVTRNGAPGCDVDFSGNELEGAPPHSLVGNARWQSLLTGATDWFVETDFQFQDDRFVNDQNTVFFPAFWQFNFRAGIVNDNFDVILFVNNAFDDDTTRTGVLVPDIDFFAVDVPDLRIPNRGRLYATQPRTYGLRLTYRFGTK